MNIQTCHANISAVLIVSSRYQDYSIQIIKGTFLNEAAELLGLLGEGAVCQEGSGVNDKYVDPHMTRIAAEL